MLTSPFLKTCAVFFIQYSFRLFGKHIIQPCHCPFEKTDGLRVAQSISFGFISKAEAPSSMELSPKHGLHRLHASMANSSSCDSKCNHGIHGNCRDCGQLWQPSLLGMAPTCSLRHNCEDSESSRTGAVAAPTISTSQLLRQLWQYRQAS